MKTLQQLADEGLFNTASESRLIRQQMFAMIKDSSMKNAIGRQLVEVVPLREGSSIDFELANKDSLMVRQMGEGAGAPIARENYTTVTVRPVKFGGNVKITTEMIEDSNFELIERNLREAGKQMANKETTLVFNAFHDSTSGFASVTTPNTHNITSAGTEIGIVDISKGVQACEDYDYYANAMAVNPEQAHELRQIDTFVEADKLGSREVIERGLIGKIFGLEVASTSLQTAGTVDILDTREAGVLVMRRPLTVEKWNEPLRDLVNATFTQRMQAAVLRAQAGAKITVQ